MDPATATETVNQAPDIIKNIVLGCTSMVTLASAITAWTRTPNKFSKFASLYRVIERFALVIGKAKQSD